MNLRDFESVLLFLSEEEIEKLQAGIDERRSRRLARDEEDCPGSVEPPVYSPNLVERDVLGSSHPGSCIAAVL